MSNARIKKLDEHIEECKNVLKNNIPREAVNQIEKIKKAL